MGICLLSKEGKPICPSQQAKDGNVSGSVEGYRLFSALMVLKKNGYLPGVDVNALVEDGFSREEAEMVLSAIDTLLSSRDLPPSVKHSLEWLQDELSAGLQENKKSSSPKGKNEAPQINTEVVSIDEEAASAFSDPFQNFPGDIPPSSPQTAREAGYVPHYGIRVTDPLYKICTGLQAQFSQSEFPNATIRITASYYGNPTEITVEGVPPERVAELLPQIIRENGIKVSPENVAVTLMDDGSVVISLIDPGEESPSSQATGAQDPSAVPNNRLNSVPSDQFAHHNQALDAIHEAQERGIVRGSGKDAPILLHFDTHSDIHNNSDGAETISSYVNSLIADGDVSEVYWVVPDWTKAEETESAFWPEEDQSQNGRMEGFLGGTEREYIAYVNKETKEVFVFPANDPEAAPPGAPSKYRKVKIHKVYQSEVPSFKSERRQIIVDIDYDYFSNTGADTLNGDPAHVQYNPGKQELLASLASFGLFLQTIKTPALVLGSYSPGYTSEEDIPEISNWFSGTFGPELIPNSAGNYSHDYANANAINAISNVRAYVLRGKPIPDILIEELSSRGMEDIATLALAYNKALETGDPSLSAIEVSLLEEISFAFAYIIDPHYASTPRAKSFL